MAPLYFPQKDWHRQEWFQHFASETACDMRKKPHIFQSNQNSTHVGGKWYHVDSKLKQNMPQVKLPSEVWFTHQSRHAKQVRFSIQHVTKHKPLVLKWLRNQLSINFACTADLHKHPSNEGLKRHNLCWSHPQHDDSCSSVATDLFLPLV